ncbi:MAG: SMC-Scp complex subunit ScpB [Actinomycetota bacterium]|nr:SMC-Scp complex subunit ScpB [Actinomycetota bacterium]
MMELTELRGIIESLLFVTTEPLSLRKMSEIVEVDEVTIKRILDELGEEYRKQGRGFQLREIAGGYRLYTHPGYAPYVEKLVLSWDQRRLTQAALETLAIIAYKQPVTKAQISSIRGVDAGTVLNSLLEKGLIREMGRANSPGQPILYGTTQVFLETFGLKDLSDLPPLKEFEPDERTRKEIIQKLTTREEGESE